MQAYEKEHTNSVDNIKEKAKEDKEIKSSIKQKKKAYITSELSKLRKGERKIVEKIYAVIKDMLPPDTSDELIKKIQSELKK
ncbi:MAG: hypothetical protein N4A48_00875 [Tepidibacter sp.]|jgi:Tfp pilus assembly protein PilO|uniref:hypothetical protein n=1 Tax=Tepidibacter sp. TaxID=2529387 RepID=UPI0025DC89DA|nr:hypothetical protein [Tepidibacter sp.]MCT4507312.1 hypothetical protein [Tepidibacter sp.]